MYTQHKQIWSQTEAITPQEMRLSREDKREREREQSEFERKTALQKSWKLVFTHWPALISAPFGFHFAITAEDLID